MPPSHYASLPSRDTLAFPGMGGGKTGLRVGELKETKIHRHQTSKDHLHIILTTRSPEKHINHRTHCVPFWLNLGEIIVLHRRHGGENSEPPAEAIFFRGGCPLVLLNGRCYRTWVMRCAPSGFRRTRLIKKWPEGNPPFSSNF